MRAASQAIRRCKAPALLHTDCVQAFCKMDFTPKQLGAVTQKRDDLKARIIAEEKKTQSTNQFLETIRKYETVTELNRSMLVELIDSIYVYQAEGTGKDRKQKVEINYRFLAGSQCGIA